MISNELRTICSDNLSSQDIREVALKTGFSFGYVRDVKNQYRYNKEIEKALIQACKQKLEYSFKRINQELFKALEERDDAVVKTEK